MYAVSTQSKVNKNKIYKIIYAIARARKKAPSAIGKTYPDYRGAVFSHKFQYQIIQ